MSLTEKPEWRDSIYELRESDPVLGGADGISNMQAAQLADRTQWLKAAVETHRTAANPHPQYAEATHDVAAEVERLAELVKSQQQSITALDSKLAEAADIIAQFGTVQAERQYQLPAPVGTRLVLAQGTAPTGWIKETRFDDAALRLVNGAAADGGVIAFTEAFASKGITGSIGSTTLTESQMAAHSHSVNILVDRNALNTLSGFYHLAYTDNRRLNHALSGYGYTNATGSSASHTHSLKIDSPDLRVRYVDVIIATKDWDD